ncbi:MAG: HAMP domain-containing histidine kinase [Gemmatimonadaceae bacterium]|nr:HAMP domain-containing histidine kinase [Gemmatimonadaceae bacterium]
MEHARPHIRLRFTLLYATTLLVVLLSAAIVTRQALRATLQREFDESVRASAELVSQFFRTEIVEYRTIEATLTHITGELVFEDRSVHIRRPDNSHFGDSIAMPRSVRYTGPAPIRAVRLPLDEALAPGWDIEVHANLANMYELRRRIDRWFALGIPAFVMVAAVAGWWLTGRTLRPVGDMVLAAERIAPASGERLPIANPQDELGRLGERFNALLDRLDGALSQQRAFLADAAHELRTPIARMRARVEVALLAVYDHSPSESDRRSTLEALEQELSSVSQHVDELLQLARADAMGEDQPLRTTPLFLDDLVSDEVARWQPRAQQTGVTLSVGLLEETPVLGDAVLLRRLVGILTDNALRYGAARGQVRLSVTSRSASGGAVATLTVDDDGPGVPVVDRQRVFDRFFRGDAARQRRADGSGLGLAIAAWIAQRHAGQIHISGSDLGGASFVVTLPRQT